MAQIDTLTNVGAVVSTDLALILRGGANVLGTLGSMVGQNSTAVTITGGTINGTVIGGTTAAAGSFTTGAFSSTLGVTGVSTLAAMTATTGTFSGNVSIDTSGNPQMLVKTSGAGNNPSVRIQADTNYWDLQTIFSNATDDFDIRYNGASRLNITSAGAATFSGTVGIGASSVNGKLDIKTSNAGFEFYPENSTDTNLIINYDRSASSYQNLQTRAATHQFFIGGTERMRIDASGNLLVGTTSSNYAAVGSQLGTGGSNYMTRSGAQPLLLNRLSSDGDILALYKDGAPVASIGAFNGVPYIGYTGGTGGGIMFNGTSIQPTALGSARTDGVNDIGSDFYRWRDLYLSGGVVFGATGGSVSSKTLDDYEEGTFTPAWVGGTVSGSQTYTTQAGFYTKVGNLVTFFIRLTLLTKGTIDGSLTLSGLPFTSLSTASSYGQAMISHATNLSIAAGTSLGCVANLGATTATIKYWNSTAGSDSLSAGALTNTSQMFIHGSYMTA